MGLHNGLRITFYPEMEENASIPVRGTVPDEGAYGCGPDEMTGYWKTFIPGYPRHRDSINFTEALVGKKVILREPKRIHLIFMNPNGRHWLLLAIDWKARAYANIGSRRMDYRLNKWLEDSKIEIDGLEDVTPKMDGQNEEDCGGRAAVFGRAFVNAALNNGKAGGVKGHFEVGNIFHIKKHRFAQVVQRVMEMWEQGRG